MKCNKSLIIAICAARYVDGASKQTFEGNSTVCLWDKQSNCSDINGMLAMITIDLPS